MKQVWKVLIYHYYLNISLKLGGLSLSLNTMVLCSVRLVEASPIFLCCSLLHLSLRVGLSCMKKLVVRRGKANRFFHILYTETSLLSFLRLPCFYPPYHDLYPRLPLYPLSHSTPGKPWRHALFPPSLFPLCNIHYFSFSSLPFFFIYIYFFSFRIF